MTEIEQSGSDGAEKDGELEPGEESALGGKMDFRLNADGYVDS